MKKAAFSESCQPPSVDREQPRTILSAGISVQLPGAGGAVLSLCPTANIPLQAPVQHLHSIIELLTLNRELWWGILRISCCCSQLGCACWGWGWAPNVCLRLAGA